MTRYAANTDVSSDRSRSEVERTLRRYQATSFAYATEPGRAMIAFVKDGRQVRFVLPLPDPNSREFTHTPARGTQRSRSAAEAAYEQAVRQRWRALALVIKAKLEAVEAGIVSFEQEFGMFMVLPDGRTAYQHVLPAIEHAYASGTVPPMLALGPGEESL